MSNFRSIVKLLQDVEKKKKVKYKKINFNLYYIYNKNE